MPTKPTYAELEQRVAELERAAALNSPDVAEANRGVEGGANVRLNMLAAASFEALFLLENGRCLDQNQTAEEMFGYALCEVRGWVGTRLVIPADRERVKANMRAGFEGCYEVTAVHKDGLTFPCEVQAKMIQHQGRSLQITAMRDISERKRVENELRGSQARFYELVEMLPEAVFETDRNFQITFANRCAFELFGYTPEELQQGINGLEIIVPEDRQRAMGNIAKRLRGEDPRTIEYHALKKDGTTFPILLHASTILKDDELVGLRGIIIDLTARKRAEREQARIADQFRQSQKMESIGRLAGGVSHDLNNLLSPIIGYGELLLDDLAAGDARRESVHEILRAGFRARDLVRQLLAFSRKQTLDYKLLDMNETIIGFWKLLRRTIREDIEIDFTPASTIRGIMADIGQMEQIIMNMAVNAADAMPLGGQLTIETALADVDQQVAATHPGLEPGDYVLLTIRDTGCGMDEETCSHIFDPFFSTKGQQGTGLGLATVYGIVKQHRGTIQVASELGLGTTFNIYLPVAEEEPVRSRPKEQRAVGPCGRETILLVEDNQQVRRLAREILSQRGYTVLTAESSAAALELAARQSGKVHLLLVDVIMPGMNGKELYRKIVPYFPLIHVLYMSGYATDVIAHHGVLAKGVNFIQKPFSVSSLTAKVREVLDRRPPDTVPIHHHDWQTASPPR